MRATRAPCWAAGRARPLQVLKQTASTRVGLVRSERAVVRRAADQRRAATLAIDADFEEVPAGGLKHSL